MHAGLVSGVTAMDAAVHYPLIIAGRGAGSKTWRPYCKGDGEFWTSAHERHGAGAARASCAGPPTGRERGAASGPFRGFGRRLLMDAKLHVRPAMAPLGDEVLAANERFQGFECQILSLFSFPRKFSAQEPAVAIGSVENSVLLHHPSQNSWARRDKI